jgi:hypothetical protein
LRDYFYNYADSAWGSFQRATVAISEDGDYFAYSNVTAPTSNSEGTVYIYTGWNGTQWDASYSITGNGFFGHGNLEFTSNKELLIGEPYGNSNRGRVYVYELSGGTWVIRGGDTSYMTQTNYEDGYFGYCADITSDGNTVVGSTYNNVTGDDDTTARDDGFFIVHDWDGNNWNKRGDLKIIDEDYTNNNKLGWYCKISNDGNMVAVWRETGNNYLRIFYWDSLSSSWINTKFSGNSGLTIDTTIFNPVNSAVDAYGACFYEDGAKVALKGLSNSAYNVYFYAFNTSNNTWELESTSPNFVLDDGNTALGSSYYNYARNINISNDGNTLCIGNRAAYSENGVLQVYKYM